MPFQRRFLGLDSPALPAVATALLDAFGQDHLADLRHVIVVVPGSRAGRRLLEVLVDTADAAGRTLVPPQITTEGQLPEMLYQAKRPFADDLAQQLIWAETLKQVDPQRLAAIINQRPDDDHSEKWHQLGRMLQSLHRELASDCLDFSDVAARGQSLRGFDEGARWQVLAEMQRLYLARLDELGLWDCQTARLYAIKHRECRIDRPIVLVAAVDLNQSVRQMLDQVADHVTSFLHAPSDWSDRFDSHGCLIPEAWHDVPLAIPEASICEADGPADQSEQVVRAIASWNGRYRAEQITIGVLDERMVAPLVRQLNESQLPNRYGPGRLLTQGRVYRFLKDLADYAHGMQYSDFARLVRHPDLDAWLQHQGVLPGWIEELDDVYTQYLPRRFEAHWHGDLSGYPRLSQACDCIHELLRPWHRPPQPLSDWLALLGALLWQVYGHRNFDLDRESDRHIWKACRVVQSTLSRLAGLLAELMPTVTGHEALRLVLDQCRSERLTPLATEPAIELVGWLELPLDDAPALIVTSFNEGLVPSSLNADLFLPGGLRSALGLEDNARRYARDAYAVATLLAPWRSATFLVGRRNTNDDPLAPSRLLFAAPPEVVAHRSRRFFAPLGNRADEPPVAGGLVSSRRSSTFKIPRPMPLVSPITRMSVTEFRTYLACPYRYYLSRVLRLKRVADDATELDGAGFGELAHHVLEQFGRSDARHATDASVIDNELNQFLHQRILDRFGRQPRAVLSVQFAQLRLRLQAFARFQAQWVAQGWQIEHTELSFSERPGSLVVDGVPMYLTGRIDRIDLNTRTGERAILDYKTSDTALHPEKTHRHGKKAWLDLQLPLYRHLARELGIEQPVRLGYVALPKRTSDVDALLADWTEADLAAADRTAEEVVRGIRAEVFWPPADPPPKFYEEFAAICQDGVFGRKGVQ